MVRARSNHAGSTVPKPLPMIASCKWLPGQGSNLHYLIQSQVSCRLDDPANGAERWNRTTDALGFNQALYRMYQMGQGRCRNIIRSQQVRDLLAGTVMCTFFRKSCTENVAETGTPRDVCPLATP